MQKKKLNKKAKQESPFQDCKCIATCIQQVDIIVLSSALEND